MNHRTGLFHLQLVSVFVAFFSMNAAADQQLPEGPFLEAYVNQRSVVAGEQLNFHLSSNLKLANLRIVRLGAEKEEVYETNEIRLAPRAIPDRASSEGCDWPVSYSLTVPDSWRSGYYHVDLQASGDSAEASDEIRRAQTTTFFVVRAAQPGSHSKILLQLAANTYNAYTNWGGHSLYGYHDRDGIQGHRVSFHRPLSSQFAKWELPFVQWAERQGFELEFAVNNDLEFRPEMLQHYNLVLSVGHDEYWSSPMRDALEGFIAKGGNVAFFSGNTCCWQVRNEDEGRALTCWKQWYNMDPLFRSDQEHLLSTAWSHHRVKRPENELTGVGFLWGGYHRSHGQFMDGPGAYKVHRPEHWVLEGTDLKRHDRFGGKDTIVGYECDGCELRWEDGLPYPTHRDGTPESFEVVATCPARWAPGDSYWYERFPKDRIGAAVLGVYERGGTVFTCGSTDWAHGLAGEDPAVEKITTNILTRLSQD